MAMPLAQYVAFCLRKQGHSWWTVLATWQTQIRRIRDSPTWWFIVLDTLATSPLVEKPASKSSVWEVEGAMPWTGWLLVGYRCMCHVILPSLCSVSWNLSIPLTTPLQGVEFWAVNTDAQALAQHAALNKLQIGTELTRGLGCGGNPQLGDKAALESEEALRKMLQAG